MRVYRALESDTGSPSPTEPLQGAAPSRNATGEPHFVRELQTPSQRAVPWPPTPTGPNGVRQLCLLAVGLVRADMLRNGIRFTLEVDDRLFVCSWSNRVLDCLTAMLADACEALPRGGDIEIVAIRTSGHCEIEVADNRAFETEAHQVSSTFAQFVARRQLVMTEIRNSGRIAAADTGLSILEQRCPQGGLARTLVLPEQIAVGIENETRRAA